VKTVSRQPNHWRCWIVNDTTEFDFLHQVTFVVEFNQVIVVWNNIIKTHEYITETYTLLNITSWNGTQERSKFQTWLTWTKYAPFLSHTPCKGPEVVYCVVKLAGSVLSGKTLDCKRRGPEFNSWPGTEKIIKLECGPMPNVMAAHPNISGALCEISVISFLVSCCSLADARCWSAPGKIPLGGKIPQKCIYSVAAEEMAKHRAKFGWPPVSDVAAVTNPICETYWNVLGCSKLVNRSQPLLGRRSPYCEDMWRRYCCLTNKFFSNCRYMP